jgi:hypothetical protein
MPNQYTSYPHQSSSTTNYLQRPKLLWHETTYPQQQYHPQIHHSTYQTTHTTPDHQLVQSCSNGIKLDFPRFDGDNPAGWLRQAEKCFALAETTLHKRVKFVEGFLVGKADHWLRSTGINTNSLTWPEFVALINSRFAAETSLKLIDTFRHMEQSSSLPIYIDQFEEVMGKLKIQSPMLPDEYFEACFISGRKDHIKVPLRSHSPTTLVQAYPLDINYEHYNQKRQQTDFSRLGYKYSAQQRQWPQAPKRKRLKTNNKSLPSGRKANASNARNVGSLGILKSANAETRFT